MELKAGECRLVLIQGDITKEETGAIVNAANQSLRGGGGVDGAIHRAGGKEILEECKKIGGCKTGEAVITTGGNLTARYVIHTVGLVWRGGNRSEPELLQSCYRKSLELAVQNGIDSVSFPSISTGAYGYPIEMASRIAVETVWDYCREHSEIQEVHFVLFSRQDFEIYGKALEEVRQSSN